MRTGKPMPYILSRLYDTSRLFTVNAMAAVAMVHASKTPAGVSSFLSSLTDCAPQQPGNLVRKFVGPSMESLTKESCSDAWDAKNGLQLLLTGKFPNEMAESPLSVASTRLSSQKLPKLLCCQSDPPGSHRSLRMLHLNSLPVPLPPPPRPLSLSLTYYPPVSVFFHPASAFFV